MNIGGKILKIGIVLLAAAFCNSTINQNSVNTQSVIYTVSNPEVVMRTENKPIIEEKKEEIVVETKKTNTTVVQNVEEPKVEVKQEETKQVETQTVTYSNSIVIGNVLNKQLLKDETGENLYLNHNVNGVYDGIGVPYIDFRNDFTTRKTIIYAHSNKSGNGPFNVLQKYHNNKSFYDNNKYIVINYGGKTYKYEIFSVYVSLAESKESEGLKYFYKMKYNDQEWAEEIQKYKDRSEYDTGVEVSASDKIIILQTCSMDPLYYEKYYRYNQLIMGKLIEVG